MSAPQHPPRNGEGERAQPGGGGAAILTQPIKAVRRARRLRREMSLPEVLLWQALRVRPGGYAFRRQHPQHPYTLDFVCLSSRLAIEVDGESHDRGDRPDRDEARDAFLAGIGFRILRLSTREVLGNIEGCVRGIVSLCREGGPPPPSLRDGPPPRAGEDF